MKDEPPLIYLGHLMGFEGIFTFQQLGKLDY